MFPADGLKEEVSQGVTRTRAGAFAAMQGISGGEPGDVGVRALGQVMIVGPGLSRVWRCIVLCRRKNGNSKLVKWEAALASVAPTNAFSRSDCSRKASSREAICSPFGSASARRRGFDPASRARHFFFADLGLQPGIALNRRVMPQDFARFIGELQCFDNSEAWQPHFLASSRSLTVPAFVGAASSKKVSRSRMIAWGMSCSLCVATLWFLRMAVPIAITSTRPRPIS
jgi:hypothetical protein